MARGDLNGWVSLRTVSLDTSNQSLESWPTPPYGKLMLTSYSKILRFLPHEASCAHLRKCTHFVLLGGRIVLYNSFKVLSGGLRIKLTRDRLTRENQG